MAGLLGFLGDVIQGGSVFQRQFRTVAAALGGEVLFVDAESGGLTVRFGPTEYRVALGLLDDRSVGVTVLSNVKFPPARLPRPVWRLLEQRNGELPHFDWVESYQDDKSRFVLRGKMALSSFNPRVVESALEEMIPEAARLDRYLVECGYAD